MANKQQAPASRKGFRAFVHPFSQSHAQCGHSASTYPKLRDCVQV